MITDGPATPTGPAGRCRIPKNPLRPISGSCQTHPVQQHWLALQQWPLALRNLPLRRVRHTSLCFPDVTLGSVHLHEVVSCPGMHLSRARVKTRGVSKG